MLAYSKCNFLSINILHHQLSYVDKDGEMGGGEIYSAVANAAAVFPPRRGRRRRRRSLSSFSRFCGRIISLPRFFSKTEGGQTFSKFILCLAWAKGSYFLGYFSFPELFLPLFLHSLRREIEMGKGWFYAYAFGLPSCGGRNLSWHLSLTIKKNQRQSSLRVFQPRQWLRNLAAYFHCRPTLPRSQFSIILITWAPLRVSIDLQERGKGAHVKPYGAGHSLYAIVHVAVAWLYIEPKHAAMNGRRRDHGLNALWSDRPVTQSIANSWSSTSCELAWGNPTVWSRTNYRPYETLTVFTGLACTSALLVPHERSQCVMLKR